MRAADVELPAKQAVAGSGPPPRPAVHGSKLRRTVAGPRRLDRVLEAIPGKGLFARRTLRAAGRSRRGGELHCPLQRQLRRPDRARQRRARTLRMAEREKRLGPDFADPHADSISFEKARLQPCRQITNPATLDFHKTFNPATLRTSRMAGLSSCRQRQSIGQSCPAIKKGSTSWQLP